MTPWTREERYRPYDFYNQEYINNLTQQVQSAPYRNHYHFEPDSGLLNDPNGFSYFQGKYHLWYQHFPFGAVHGLKKWSHATSSDLFKWEKDELTIEPSTAFDNAGVYSGSAINLSEDEQFIFYTGNHRDSTWERTPYQMGAIFDGKKVVKFDKPLIEPDEAFTDHFRDPQVFKEDGYYYTVIGAQKKNGVGCIALYQSIDLKQWQKLTTYDFPASYMVECPNLIKLSNKWVLIFCPQGIESHNIFPQCWMTFDDLSFSNPSKINILDYGFDCYATQCFDKYAIGWSGLPDINYPTEVFGYQGCMTLARKLRLDDGKLYQEPMINSKKPIKVVDQNSYHAQIDISGDAEIHFYENKDKRLTLSVKSDKIVLDRSNVGARFDVEHGETREISDVQIKTIDAFVDTSIIELFINNGEYVLTSRVFPNPKQTGFSVKGEATYQLYEFNYD